MKTIKNQRIKRDNWLPPNLVMVTRRAFVRRAFPLSLPSCSCSLRSGWPSASSTGLSLLPLARGGRGRATLSLTPLWQTSFGQVGQMLTYSSGIILHGCLLLADGFNESYKNMSQRKISSSSLQLKAMNQQFGQLVNPLMAARYQAAARYQQANNGLQTSQSQMYGSFSGGGYGHDGGSPGGSCFSIDICPDLILALITAAGAAAALGFYLQIVAVGRRRKRSLGKSPWSPLLQPLVGSLFGLGSCLQILSYCRR